VVVKRHRKRQAPARESMSSAIQTYASMLERQSVLVFDLGIKRIDVDDELAGKSCKLKVRMDGVTHLKTNSAKAVQVAGDHFRLEFDTLGSVIFEGGRFFDLELCQTHCFSSSQKLANCRLNVETILENMDRKTWALELLSVSTPGKVLATFELQLECRSTALRSVGGAKALKTMRVPNPPTHIKSGSVFAFKADADEASDFVQKAGEAHERLEAAFNYAGKKIQSETESDRFPRAKHIKVEQ
jgi:hypothetical protein